MTHNILFAGFGGQGILFSGKVLAYGGMVASKQLSWLPSYGPEMRGGTANCSVIISDEPIGSPLVLNPDILVVMNGPSYDRFEPAVVSGGIIIADSSLISAKTKRGDITEIRIPATQLAIDNDIKGLANMIMLGAMMRHVSVIPREAFEDGLKKAIPARKADMLENNLKAIKIGYDFN